MAVVEKYPQYTSGIAVYSKNEENSYCYICPSKSPIASEEHLKNPDHLSTLAYYLHNFIDNGPFVSCKLCSMWLEYSSIKDHAITHKLMPWYRPDEEFKIFYVNWISSKNNEYYCHLCYVKLLSWFHAIFHTEETVHRALRENKINEAAIKELPLTWTNYRVIGHLASFMGTTESSMCALCCVPSGIVHNQILKHTEGVIHVRNMEAFKKALKKALVHVPPVTGSFDYDYYSHRVDDSAANNSDGEMVQISLSFCTVCHKVIDSKRIEAHLETHDDDLPDSTDDVTQGSRKKDGCDVEKSKGIFQNISFPINKKMKPYRISHENDKTDRTEKDNCHECSCSMKLCRNEDLWLHHKILRKSDQFQVRGTDSSCKSTNKLKSNAHNSLPKQDTEAGESSFFPEGINYNHSSSLYSCTLCGWQFLNFKDIMCHIDSLYHLNKLRFVEKSKVKIPNNDELKLRSGDPPKTRADEEAEKKNEEDILGLPEGILFLSNYSYRCTICDCLLNGKVNIQEHVNAARHREKLPLWKKNKNKILCNNADVAPIITQNAQSLPQDVVMTDNPNFFWCRTCSVKISGYKCVIQHINGLSHNNKKLVLSISTVNINSNSSNSNLKIESNKGHQLASTKITKESLPSSSISKVNCSSAQGVNVEGDETLKTKKKKVRTRQKKEVIDTNNIVSASVEKIQSVVKTSSSVNKIVTCEIYPEKKKSPGKDDSFKCDSCNIKLRGYTELLSHVMAEECKPSTIKEVNELESYKFAETMPGKLKITKFVGGKEVEAVDIPEELLRISRRTYYCSSCRCNLVGGESIFKHATAAVHRENVVKRIEEDKDYKFVETSAGKRKIVKFVEEREVEAVEIPEIFMRITSTEYYCSSCCCNLSGGESILKHAKSPVHGKDLIEKNGENNGINKSVAMNGKSGLIENSVNVKKLPPHIVGTEKENVYWCQICSVKIASYTCIPEHENGSKHKKKMNSLNKPERYEFAETSPGKLKIMRFVDEKGVEAVDIPEIFMRITSTNYYCLSCNCDLIGGESILKHAKAAAHGKDLIKKNEKDKHLNKSVPIDGQLGLIEKSAEVQKLPLHIVTTEKENQYWCQICSIQICSYESISVHENGAKHKKTMNSANSTFDQSLFPDITVIPERKNEFWCKVCSVRICGPKTVVQHVNAPKHMEQMKDPVNLPISGEVFSGVSDKRNGESLPITANEKNWKTNNYLSMSSSSSPEKYALCNGNISLDSIATHNDGKLNNNKELMRESVKSIYSPGDEVFMTECRICKEIILGDSRSVTQHVDSKRHEETLRFLSYLGGSALGSKPKLDKHEEIKYFIADKQVDGDESVINVVEVPKGETKDSGTWFTWCSACCIKVDDDFHLNEHLKSSFHLRNFKEKFIICKSFDGRDDNDDSKSDEKDQHRNYFEGIKEIHGEDYFLCTICNGLKLFDRDAVFEHVKSLVHLNNQKMSLGNGETGEDEVFFNEMHWNTSEKSAEEEETKAQSMSPNFQLKTARGSSSENDFFSCSSEKVPKINEGPSDAQMIASMGQLNLNSEKNEKASQDTEVSFFEGSCSSLSYEQREEDDWIQLCPGSDGSVDYYKMGDDDFEFVDEFSVSESATTSQIPENIRIPKKQTAASLREAYNVEGTDIWICLVCQNYQIYTPITIITHLQSVKHSKWKMQMLWAAPKPLNNTKFIISPKFKSEGIVAIPTKKFAVCTLCNCKVTTEDKANAHISSAKHQQHKMTSCNNEKKESKLNSILPFSLRQSLPDGIEKFSDKDFLLCTICRKKLLDSEIDKHIRDIKHIQNGKSFIVKIDEDRFRCKPCGIIRSGYLDLVNHLNTPGHNNTQDPPKIHVHSSKNTNKKDPEKRQCYIFMNKLMRNPQQVYNDLKSKKKTIPNFIKILPEGILRIKKININWCMTCNCHVGKNFQSHLSGKRHRETLDNNELPQDIQAFYCELCGRDVIGKENWEAHILGAEHKRNERELLGVSSTEGSDKASVESPRRIQPMISNFQLAESDNSLEDVGISGSSKPGGVKIPQKYQPMVDCNICHCKVPGGDANISNHRNSREHKDNEAKLFDKLKTPGNTGNSVGNVSATTRSFNTNIPLDAYSQYHYRNDGSIDFIECKVCDLNISGIGHISANYMYAFHMQSEVHKIKEKEFAEKWKSSPVSFTSGSRSSVNSSKSSAKSFSRKTKEPTRKSRQRGSGLQKLLIKFDGHKAVCPICYEVLKSKSLLHSHMTSHFWRRFTKNPPPIPEKASEEPAKPEPSRCTEDSDEELVINESPMKPLKRQHFRRKPLDIEIMDSMNIYEIDKQKMSEIRAGVLLSLPKDKNSIYCLICRCNVSSNLQTFYEHLCSVKHLDYLKDILDDDKLFQNSKNQLSDLALGYEYMEDISDAAVKCHACEISVINKFSKLHKHINSASHIDKWTALDENSRALFKGLKSKMECNFYSIRKYWCVICNSEFITECKFQKHLMRKKHLKKTRKFGDQFLMFDYCGVCASLWYGFLKTFSYHSDCIMHKYHKLDGFFSIEKLPESAERLLNSPGEEIEAIMRGLEFRRAIDKSKENQLLRDLREIAVVKYPSAVAHPFGSRITGLGGRNSDLDVFLDCPTKKTCMYFGENSHPELIERRLVRIKECLENNTNIWHIDREILDCRIPIIKTKHKPTDIECDLSFTNGLTVENTALIRNYCDKSSDCRKLIIFIKNWMNHCELSGANGIISYAIAWLVIYFLQTKKILPTVHQLIEMNNKSQLIAGWETGVSKDFQVQTFAGSFGELLNEFFKFYGNFDYRHDVICPLLGEIVKKIDFQHRGKLPSAMGPYLNYLYDTGDAEPFRIDSIMCLQDPFDLAHNITKAVKKFNIYKFKTFCSYSAEILDNNR